MIPRFSFVWRVLRGGLLLALIAASMVGTSQRAEAVSTKVRIDPYITAEPVTSLHDFTVDVRVDDVTAGLGGFQFWLVSNPTIVVPLSVSTTAEVQNLFLGKTGRTVTCILRSVTPSTVKLYCITIGPTPPLGATGSGVLARVTYSPVGNVGTTALDLQNVTLASVSGSQIPATVEDGLASVILCADVDGSNSVDGTDIAIVIDRYGTYNGGPGWNPACDIDGSGAVDGTDIALTIAAFGFVCSGPGP